MYAKKNLLLEFLDELDRLQRLQALAQDVGRRAGEVGWADTTVLVATVDLGQGTDSGTTNVQMSSDRCTSNVEPVWVGRGQLLEGSGLDEVVPGWHLELAGPIIHE